MSNFDSNKRKALMKKIISLTLVSTLSCSTMLPASAKYDDFDLSKLAALSKIAGEEADENLKQKKERIKVTEEIEQKMFQKYNIKDMSELPKLNPKQQSEFLAEQQKINAIRNSSDFSKGKISAEEMIENSAANFMSDPSKALATSAKMFLPFVAIIFIAKYAGDIVNTVKNLALSMGNTFRTVVYKMTHKGIDVNSYQLTLDRIEKRLRAELVGQDEAIDKTLEVMAGYFESVAEAKAMNKKFEGGLLLYFYGPPATGKSTTMKIIKEEMKLDSYTGLMSDAVEDKGNGAMTVAARLTKPIYKDNGQAKTLIDTPLMRQVKNKLPTLYCLDEVDKMRKLDATLQNRSMRDEDGYIVGSSVDEMLRNFGDTGQICGVDASGSVLIATSNETDEKIAQLESSLFNRYKNCKIKFKEFSSDGYKEIIERKSVEFRDYYKKKFNIEIEWDKSALNHYAEVYESEKSGGRGVDFLMNDVRYALKCYHNNYETKEGFKNLKLSIGYNDKSNKLCVKQIGKIASVVTKRK